MKEFTKLFFITPLINNEKICHPLINDMMETGL